MKALEMRRQGRSIGTIARELGVSRSSVSVWCRDIRLSADQTRQLKESAIAAGSSGRLLGAKKNHDLKMEKVARFLQEGKLQTGDLSRREALFVGAALYWGEGTKKGQLSFVNSDKDMVIFIYKWFRDVLGIQDRDFIFRIFINESHRSRKHAIENYWKALLKIPDSQFRSMVFIKSVHKKKHKNHEHYYGLLSIRVRRSTDLKYKILGLIEGLKYSTFRSTSA